MKLLLLSSLYPPVNGGAELQAQNLANYCTDLGVSVTVLTQPQVDTPKEEVINGVHIIRRLDTIHLGPMWGLTYMASSFRCLRRLVDSETVIHNQQVSLHSWPSQHIASAYDIPLILRFACAGKFGDLARLRSVRYGFKLLPALRKADRFIVLSSELYKEVISSGFPEDRVRFRPNGVDIQRFRPMVHEVPGIHDNIFRLLFVGRLDEQKGLEILLRALADLNSDQNWSLDIYGKGPLETKLRHMCSQLGINNHIKFRGYSECMEDIYRDADLLVLPSLHEGMPNVILEAMASGLPVLASDIGGCRELLQDWAADWLVKSADSEALALALQRAIQQRDLLPSLGARARREAEHHYSFRSLAVEYLEDCEQLLRATRRRS